MPRLLLGPAAYYAALGAYEYVEFEPDRRWSKREKELHRYEIADTRGRLRLTVPVSLPADVEGAMTRSRVLLSQHGEWWRVHRTALESAYGRTPYFEFVFDRFAPLFEDPGAETRLIDYLECADRAVMDFLGIVLQPVPDGMETEDLRRTDFYAVENPRYTQVREQQLGFLPGLSILDLIFNLGPEAQLYLAKAVRLDQLD